MTKKFTNYSNTLTGWSNTKRCHSTNYTYFAYVSIHKICTNDQMCAWHDCVYLMQYAQRYIAIGLKFEMDSLCGKSCPHDASATTIVSYLTSAHSFQQDLQFNIMSMQRSIPSQSRGVCQSYSMFRHQCQRWWVHHQSAHILESAYHLSATFGVPSSWFS